MPAQAFFYVDFTHWTTWPGLGVGLAVSLAVFWVLYRRGVRRRLARFSTEEDLPWEDLLEMLRARQHERAESGSLPEDDLPPDQLLGLLLSRLPAKSSRSSAEARRDGGAERRGGRRRWGNPTDVVLTSPLLARDLHGVVINRSTGGLAIFVDQELRPGMLLQVRSLEAPRYVSSATVDVKHCAKVGRSFLIGCEFTGDVPWNVRVWFG